jgi:hypothetical protein
MPLKVDMIGDVFLRCPNLTVLDLVGGVHRTVASLHLESWRHELIIEINRINQVLPNTLKSILKSREMKLWMRSVMSQLDHYKVEHKSLLKEATTLLELPLWKANLMKTRELYLTWSEFDLRGDDEESKERDLRYMWCEHSYQECIAFSHVV